MKQVKTTFNIFNGIGKKYLESDQDENAFYAYSPLREKSFSERSQAVYQEYKGDRNALSLILLSNNKALGCGAPTLNSIEKLRDAKALAVVTGQQAGFLSGPLYTIYKAITTIKLAKEQEEKRGVPVVPVFWVASEDHDFEEVASTYLATDRLKRITIKRPHTAKSSIGEMPINDNVIEMTKWFISHLSEKPQSKLLKTLLMDALQSSDNLAVYFSKIMTGLFKKHGLVIIDPMWEGIRALQKDFMECAVDQHSVLFDKYQRTTELLLDQGYTPQLNFMENSLFLFMRIHGERQRLQYVPERTGVVAKDGSFLGTLDALKERVVSSPELFSTNVALRPIGQDVLLPTLAYVAGPGEMNYYSQLKELYPVFNKSMPIIFPRENFTVVEPAMADIADKYDYEPVELLKKSKHEMHQAVLRKIDTFGIEARFDAFFNEFDGIYENLMNDIKKSYPGIESLQSKNQRHLRHQIEYLKKKVRQEQRKESKDVIKEVDLLLDHLSPKAQLQERCFNFLMYYCKYGDRLIDYLIEEVEIKTDHCLIYT